MSWIEQATSARVYYLTNVFTPHVVQSLIGVVALAAILGFAGGLIGSQSIYTHSLSTISFKTVYVLIGIGSGLIFGDFLALIVLSVKYFLQKRNLQCYFESETIESWYLARFQELQMGYARVWMEFTDWGDVYIALVLSRQNEREIIVSTSLETIEGSLVTHNWRIL